MTISADLITKLRDATGAGILEVQKALEASGGDLDAAASALRKKGIVKAVSKSDRVAREGRVHAYIHAGGKVGVLVELHAETDFVARTSDFEDLLHDLALHIAAANPLYIRPEDVPGEVLQKEREIVSEQARASGKPSKVQDQMVDGRMAKYVAEICLLKQAFIKDETMTVEDRVKAAIAKLGENITVHRFCRFAVEGGAVCPVF